MVEGEHDTDDVDGNPEKVEDVMSERSLYEWTGWLCRSVIDVCCHRSTKECRSKVDGNTGEPEDRIMNIYFFILNLLIKKPLTI